MGMIFRNEAKASFRDWVRWRSRTFAITRCVCRSSKGCPGTGDTALTTGTKDEEGVEEEEGELLLGLLGPGAIVDGPSRDVLSSSGNGPPGSFLGPVKRFRAPDGVATTTGHLLARRSCSSSLGRTPPSGKSLQDCSSRMAVFLRSMILRFHSQIFRFVGPIKDDSTGKQSKPKQNRSRLQTFFNSKM